MNLDKEIVGLEHDLLRADDLLQLLRNLPDEDDAQILGCVVYVPTVREVLTDAALKYTQRATQQAQAIEQHLQGNTHLRGIDGGAS